MEINYLLIFLALMTTGIGAFPIKDSNETLMTDQRTKVIKLWRRSHLDGHHRQLLAAKADSSQSERNDFPPIALHDVKDYDTEPVQEDRPQITKDRIEVMDHLYGQLHPSHVEFPDDQSIPEESSLNYPTEIKEAENGEINHPHKRFQRSQLEPLNHLSIQEEELQDNEFKIDEEVGNNLQGMLEDSQIEPRHYQSIPEEALHVDQHGIKEEEIHGPYGRFQHPQLKPPMDFSITEKPVQEHQHEIMEEDTEGRNHLYGTLQLSQNVEEQQHEAIEDDNGAVNNLHGIVEQSQIEPHHYLSIPEESLQEHQLEIKEGNEGMNYLHRRFQRSQTERLENTNIPDDTVQDDQLENIEEELKVILQCRFMSPGNNMQYVQIQDLERFMEEGRKEHKGSLQCRHVYYHYEPHDSHSVPEEPLQQDEDEVSEEGNEGINHLQDKNFPSQIETDDHHDIADMTVNESKSEITEDKEVIDDFYGDHLDNVGNQFPQNQFPDYHNFKEDSGQEHHHEIIERDSDSIDHSQEIQSEQLKLQKNQHDDSNTKTYTTQEDEHGFTEENTYRINNGLWRTESDERLKNHHGILHPSVTYPKDLRAPVHLGTKNNAYRQDQFAQNQFPDDHNFEGDSDQEYHHEVIERGTDSIDDSQEIQSEQQKLQTNQHDDSNPKTYTTQDDEHGFTEQNTYHINNGVWRTESDERLKHHNEIVHPSVTYPKYLRAPVHLGTNNNAYHQDKFRIYQHPRNVHRFRRYFMGYSPTPFGYGTGGYGPGGYGGRPDGFLATTGGGPPSVRAEDRVYSKQSGGGYTFYQPPAPKMKFNRWTGPTYSVNNKDTKSVIDYNMLGKLAGKGSAGVKGAFSDWGLNKYGNQDRFSASGGSKAQINKNKYSAASGPGVQGYSGGASGGFNGLSNANIGNGRYGNGGSASSAYGQDYGGVNRPYVGHTQPLSPRPVPILQRPRQVYGWK